MLVLGYCILLATKLLRLRLWLLWTWVPAVASRSGILLTPYHLTQRYLLFPRVILISCNFFFQGSAAVMLTPVYDSTSSTLEDSMHEAIDIGKLRQSLETADNCVVPETGLLLAMETDEWSNQVGQMRREPK